MMRPLWLDYQRDDPRRRRSGWLVLGLGLLAGTLLLAYQFSLSADVDDLEREVARLKRAAARQLPAEGGDAALRASGGAPRSAAQWEALFAALEAAGDDSVTLLALQPGGKEIAIAGEARDLAASTDYVARLQSSPVLADVHLTQSELVLTHPQRPLRFALAATWREGGR